MDSSLLAISPLDGRYNEKTRDLSAFFSEYALFKYRVMVEIEYIIALSEFKIPGLKEIKDKDQKMLRSLYEKFDLDDAKEIKEIEKTTNHDVKAVEYFIKGKLNKTSLKESLEFIHFGLTSQDINNTANPLLLKDSIEKKYLPTFKKLILVLTKISQENKAVSMLARTHGQPASPTTLGKEINVFVSRLNRQLEQLKKKEYVGKFGGATGNFNAHVVAYPTLDWVKFANNFLKRLGLYRNPVTTQIDSYDNLAEICHNLARINTILIDLNRDIWQYISMEYFTQEPKKGEIGSSAMPHKINPIDFENSEGNLGVANALLYHFAEKLPISRLQRDLTDSTVLRNLGVPIAHTITAFESTLKGLGKLTVNADKIKDDLNSHPEILAEAVQTVLRRDGVNMPYEQLMNLTRGKKVTFLDIKKFISDLKVNDDLKKELLSLTPENYTGLASKLFN